MIRQTEAARLRVRSHGTKKTKTEPIRLEKNTGMYVPVETAASCKLQLSMLSRYIYIYIAGHIFMRRSRTQNARAAVQTACFYRYDDPHYGNCCQLLSIYIYIDRADSSVKLSTSHRTAVRTGRETRSYIYMVTNTLSRSRPSLPMVDRGTFPNRYIEGGLPLRVVRQQYSIITGGHSNQNLRWPLK